MPQPANKAYQLKVSLLGAQPPIWRRLLIAPDTTFQDLHRIIQLAMGWQACHLHMFQAGDDRLIGDPAEDFDGMLNFQDETMVAVSAVLNKEGQALTYDYDFGDSWEHEVRLEKVLPGDQGEPLPRCIKAVRQCPPEDVGGLPGFYDFLEAMEDAAHPEHVAVREWMGGEWFEPEFVDLDDINQALAKRDALFSETESEPDIPPARDFFGLSPSQVYELLQNPLNCPSVFKPLINAEAVNRELDTAPVIRMAKVLVEAMKGKGIRLTGKGNLPLKQVKAMIEAGGEEIVAPMARYSPIRSEEHILAVILTRVLLEIAGYTKKQKGVLSLKKTAEARLEKKGWLTVYQDLLTTALTRLNWASMDHYEGMEDIQYIGPFCFWLLSQKGDQWRPVQEYLDDILKAFPRLPIAAYPVSYMSEEDQAKSALRSRMITLCQMLGLIELSPEFARLRDESEQVMRRTALFEGMFVRG
ncbi:plasmid pRiA4b ORF-3 family protein [Marinobacter sp. Arc7-DN-1]|uniref:plasmid pRiA4b ORF-3 family protein n=1 Tax=Marinobacter sp. Arc7-DN-1 TaxID=2304594 RepID=UPI000E44FEA8|nr:plasmid pRiA4b ORF-3 family protein [Marinobacter sp. Arc7-DN-1]AXS82483.1 plasmid pRiA4b ORF-3 family protein [Marinobacter sp. Arc7-DN-1]